MNNSENEFSYETPEIIDDKREQDNKLVNLVRRYGIWFVILSVGYTIYGLTQDYGFIVSCITGIVLGALFVGLMMMRSFIREKLYKKKD